MSGHTPGPWTFESDDFIVYSKDDSPVASVHEAYDFPCLEEAKVEDVQAECEANARLIAAAPDLLEACKVALESLRSFNEMSVPREMREAVKRSYEHSPEIKGLVAAIKKAEGIE